MYKNTRFFVNPELKLMMEKPPIEPLTEAQEAARLNEIPVINQQLQGPKALLPKPLASYLLKTTELTEKTLHEAQTCRYGTADVVIVRCQFDNENVKFSTQDVFFSCPGNAIVNDVLASLAEYLGTDERVMTLNVYLDSSRNKLLNGSEVLRGLASKNSNSFLLVFFVKFAPLDLWKESFVFETAKEDHGDSNEKSPSTSAPSSEAQPSTSQQSNETPAPEALNAKEEESDDMPHLDMETPCEEPERLPPPPVEHGPSPIVSLPKTGQSEARIVYVERPPNHMQPPHPSASARTVHRPPPAPNQQEGMKSVNLKIFYTIVTRNQKIAILQSVGQKLELPQDIIESKILDEKFSTFCSPGDVINWLNKDHEKRRATLPELERAAQNTDSSSLEKKIYLDQKKQCDNLDFQIKKLTSDYRKAAKDNDQQKRQQHSSQLLPNRHLSLLQSQSPHVAVSNQKFKLGAPVSISQLSLNHMTPVGTLNVGSSAPRFTTISSNEPTHQRMVMWNFAPSSRPKICDRDRTLQALQEYATFAEKHNIPPNTFLESYKAAECEPKQGTMVTTEQYEGFHSRRKCNNVNVMIPFLTSEKQEALYHAVLAVGDNRHPESMETIRAILGWDEQDSQKRNLDDEYSATRNIVPPPKVRRVNGFNRSSPTSSERSFASNMSSPESSETPINETASL